jgi:hypothetical protein
MHHVVCCYSNLCVLSCSQWCRLLLLPELALDKLYPGYNNKTYFTEFVNPYDDIVKETIPYVQA